ncbi:MAG: DUF6514 family protein [Clostridiales bacterium]|nr:DUF6514 family protein [Clostridiales bacterium]
MSDNDLDQRQWIVQEDPYTIEYKILYSINPAFEDFELWEYGISCRLFDGSHSLLSESEVVHISPDKTFVNALITTMCKHKVFPIHLYDVVYDELVKNLEYSFE